MSITADERRTLIERAWAAAWDRGEVDTLDEVLSPDYVRWTTDGHGQDRATFKATILASRDAFPDLTTTIDEIVVEGDRAAVRWHSEGTHEHPFSGVPATGRQVRVTGATFVRFEDGLVAEEFVTWDPRALLSALGIITVGQDD